MTKKEAKKEIKKINKLPKEEKKFANVCLEKLRGNQGIQDTFLGNMCLGHSLVEKKRAFSVGR